MSARVLVVEHGPSCPLDLLGGWLAEAGAEAAVCRPYAGDPVPERVAHDGLVVLGGHAGALDDAEAPRLPAVRRRPEAQEGPRVAGLAPAPDGAAPRG